MQLYLAPAAAAVMLLLLAGAGVFAADGMAQDDVCTGSKPFREAAQDETRTKKDISRPEVSLTRQELGKFAVNCKADSPSPTASRRC